jgi:3D (Asp-Asp-Asp) domain-containing protein
LQTVRVCGCKLFCSRKLREKGMKSLLTFLGFACLVVNAAAAAGRDQPLLVRITVYWRGEGSGERASSNGMRLHTGHCAVDPRKIPFGSRVFFDDGCLVAVDSGPDVINRKAARLSGRNARERHAPVIDRYFESKSQAMAWAASHPHFMNVRIVPPGSPLPQKSNPGVAAIARKTPNAAVAGTVALSQPNRIAVTVMNGLSLH